MTVIRWNEKVKSGEKLHVGSAMNIMQPLQGRPRTHSAQLCMLYGLNGSCSMHDQQDLTTVEADAKINLMSACPIALDTKCVFTMEYLLASMALIRSDK